MAIKSIKFSGTEMIESGSISFANSNIVSIVGMNGSGKSILMRNLQENHTKEWFKQIVHAKDMEKVESELSKIFKSGISAKKFKEYSEEVKKDNMKEQVSVRDKFDDFIWDTFMSSYEGLIRNNFDEKTAEEMLIKIKQLSEDGWFDGDTIIEELPELDSYLKLDKLDESSNKLDKVWTTQFGQPKIRSIDLNSDISLSGSIHKNGLGNPSLQASLKNGESLFVRLIRVAGLESKFSTIAKTDGWFTDEHNKLINDWLKSYLSQNIKIKLVASTTAYNIWFYEMDEEERIEFNFLSSGTKNLIKIISQLGELNSETVIQIDEPETGMHPIMQIQFRDFLEDLTKSYQVRFIVYTHSTHIVKDGPSTVGLNIMLRKDGVSKLYTKDDYANKSDINDIQIFEQIGYESIEKAYNFDTSKKIIVAEGDTDVIYLRKMAKLLGIDVNITRSKLGGASSVDKTAVLLAAVHNFDTENIILSPDLDIEEKHKKLFKTIKDGDLGKYVPVGTEEWPEIEGMFDLKDKRYIANKSSNNNAKMNRANLFWREVNAIEDLSNETVDTFKNYFEKIK